MEIYSKTALAIEKIRSVEKTNMVELVEEVYQKIPDYKELPKKYSEIKVNRFALRMLDFINLL
jgi:hypothetical protein